MSTIGERVLEHLAQVQPAVQQRDIAEKIGMTPDALSRALHDKRQFASIELAQLADLIGADLHWLITGEPDPNRVTVAARHKFDHATRQRSSPGASDDEQVLKDIALAYRQAYPSPALSARASWPRSPAAMRKELGPDFVRPFADRLEEHLGIGVIRVPELSTAYSFTVGGRAVIALPATGSWFRENWDMAHEVNHLIEGHHAEGISPETADRQESAANAFAAELLLPAKTLMQVSWDSITNEDLASLVWSWGVSTNALCWRLSALFGDPPPRVVSWAAHPTQRLLRLHLPGDSELDEITRRMDSAAQRRFPRSLQEAHLERVAAGAIGRATLAWMLGIDPDALDVDSPEVPEVDVDELAAALGL